MKVATRKYVKAHAAVIFGGNPEDYSHWRTSALRKEVIKHLSTPARPYQESNLKYDSVDMIINNIPVKAAAVSVHLSCGKPAIMDIRLSIPQSDANELHKGLERSITR